MLLGKTIKSQMITQFEHIQFKKKKKRKLRWVNLLLSKKVDWKQSRQLNLFSALLLFDVVELVFESESMEDIKVITV